MNSLAAKLLICVARRGRGDYVANVARQSGAPGGTILFGRGTGSNAMLRMLGLADTAKELVFTVAFAPVIASIIKALKQDPNLCRKTPGIGFVIDVEAFYRPANKESSTEKNTGDGKVEQSAHELICAIVNAGLADELMHEARKAGAKGGTILKARGTATGADSGFFGIVVVPEKEVLLILSSRSQADAIADAVAGASCLMEPGSGVVFRMPVEEFFQLGAKANS